MRYYVAENGYGSSTSRGFANTWNVLVFDSKSARDKYVAASNNITTQAIKRTEAPRYATNYNLSTNREYRPEPFTGEFWGIVPLYRDVEVEGCLGELEVCEQGEPWTSFY